MGRAPDALRLRPDLGVSHRLTGMVGGLTSLYMVRLLLGVGEGATFPVATRAMQSWTPPARRGFAQGLTHAFSRVGNSITPPLVAYLIAFISWRGSFVALGIGSLAWVFTWFWYYRDVPAEHSGVTAADRAMLPNDGQGISRKKIPTPWGPLIRRMAPITLVYFCYGWTLWLYLNWLPSYFVHEYKLDLKGSAVFSMLVFLAGVGGDYLGGVISDRILEKTHDLKKARRDFVVVSFLGSFLCMLPVFLTHNLTLIVISLAGAFFCAELTIGPMWAIPMDVAPRYSGTAAGLMNTGSAVAAVLSPIAFGYIVDGTGNWQLPCVMGSAGDTWTSWDFRMGVTARAAASPMVRPIPTGSMPCVNTSVRMSRAVAPIAVRMPISCVRWLTECAMTAYRPTDASRSAIAAKIRNRAPLNRLSR